MNLERGPFTRKLEILTADVAGAVTKFAGRLDEAIADREAFENKRFSAVRRYFNHDRLDYYTRGEATFRRDLLDRQDKLATIEKVSFLDIHQMDTSDQRQFVLIKTGYNGDIEDQIGINSHVYGLEGKLSYSVTVNGRIFDEAHSKKLAKGYIWIVTRVQGIRADEERQRRSMIRQAEQERQDNDHAFQRVLRPDF